MPFAFACALACLAPAMAPANAQTRSAHGTFGVTLTILPKFNISEIRPSGDGFEAVVASNARQVDLAGRRVRLDAPGSHTIRLPKSAVIEEASGLLRIVHSY